MKEQEQEYGAGRTQEFEGGIYKHSGSTYKNGTIFGLSQRVCEKLRNSS